MYGVYVVFKYRMDLLVVVYAVPLFHIQASSDTTMRQLGRRKHASVVCE